MSDRLSSVRSSRATFWATSASVYSGIVSRNTSASPRPGRGRPGRPMLSSSAASAQPRLTARLVVPTPPVAPVDGDHLAAVRIAGPTAVLLARDALQRGGEVFRLERLGEELLRPGPHRPQNQVAVGRAAGDQDRALGRVLGKLARPAPALGPDCCRARRSRCRASSGRRRRRRTRSASIRPRAKRCPSPSSTVFSASRVESFGSTTAIRRTFAMSVRDRSQEECEQGRTLCRLPRRP